MKLFLVAALLLSGSVWASSGRPLIFAHRGGRAAHPEGSAAAFEHAMRLGVDYLDSDLHVTRDNVVVLHHNALIDPALCLKSDGNHIESGEKILIRSLTLAELKQY